MVAEKEDVDKLCWKMVRNVNITCFYLVPLASVHMDLKVTCFLQKE